MLREQPLLNSSVVYYLAQYLAASYLKFIMKKRECTTLTSATLTMWLKNRVVTELCCQHDYNQVLDSPQPVRYRSADYLLRSTANHH